MIDRANQVLSTIHLSSIIESGPSTVLKKVSIYSIVNPLCPKL